MSVIKKHKEGEFVIVHTCCLIVTTRDNALMRVYYYLMRTMGLGDEQDGFSCFPLSNRTEKVPPGGGGLSPCKQSPRILI